MTFEATTRPTDTPDLAAYQRAARTVYEACDCTPIVAARGDAALPEDRGRAWLKVETLQPIGSFKLRGIYHAVATMSPDERARGLLTVSAGNTAQAVAWCGRHFDVPAASLMPESAPSPKIDAVRSWGATPRLVPTDELFRFLREHLWKEEDVSFVHPWTDSRVHLGHGSLGLEIADWIEGRSRPAPLNVYLSVGGGGLLAGVAGALRAAGAPVRIVAVEPAGCPSLERALDAGRPVDVDCSTFCDGVAVPYMTDEMFPVLRDLIDDILLVDDDDTRRALRDLAYGNSLVAEGSAAITLAAARRQAAASPEPADHLCVLSGGSIDRALLREILQDG